MCIVSSDLGFVSNVCSVSFIHKMAGYIDIHLGTSMSATLSQNNKYGSKK